MQVRAEKLQNVLIQERQKRAVAEKELRRLRSECVKLKGTPAARVTASRGGWRTINPFRGSTLQAIHEDADERSSTDALSSIPSVHSAGDGADLARDTTSEQPAPAAWIWGEEARASLRKWLAFAAVCFLLLLLVLLLVLVIPISAARPQLAPPPVLLPHSVLGDVFSVQVEVDMRASIHYVVVSADEHDKLAVDSPDLLSSLAIAGAALPGATSDITGVRFASFACRGTAHAMCARCKSCCRIFLMLTAS